MIIRSPGRDTPTLKASLAASTVPATTGVPAASPVSAAAAAVTVPITSLLQARSGSHPSGQMARVISGSQRRSRRS